MSSNVLRAAVIGVGAMGRHHVRVIKELEATELVAVADVMPETTSTVASEFGVPGYTDIAQMLDEAQPEIVSIVVPTTLHSSVTTMALERGIHVLVEKPIAVDVEEAEAMIALAAKKKLVLWVGHIERFNPAILELKKRISQAGKIYQVIAERMGPFPERIRDVGVVMDLATHDIDTMHFILDDTVSTAYGATGQHLHRLREDLVSGVMRFTDGTIGSLNVNWLTSTKVRRLTVIGSHGTFVADYLSQDLHFYANAEARSNWTDFSDLQSISIGESEQYEFVKEEPLKAEIRGFADCVSRGDLESTSARDALNALRVAQALVE